jgi:hypothetical protein
MRNRILVAALCAVALLTGGLAVAQSANAAGASNVLCAKNGSRELTVFSGTCPAGFFRAQLTSADVYGLDTAPAPAPAPSGGDVLKAKDVHVALSLNSPASQVVTIAGMPAYNSASVFEFSGNNGADVPQVSSAISPPNITVTPLTPAKGSTERQFRVNQSGFVSGQTFDLRIYVVAVAP